MAWDEVEMPVSGRFGFGIFSGGEFSLTGKWLWRFMNENGNIWWRVIEARFGTMNREWYIKLLTRPHGKGM